MGEPLWTRFDDETVVFNPLTWETHLLNGAAANVLALLIEDPAARTVSEADVREWLAEAGGGASADVDALVRLLCELGLIGAAGGPYP